MSGKNSKNQNMKSAVAPRPAGGAARKKITQNENRPKDASNAPLSTAAMLEAINKRIEGHIDPYSDEMEAKYAHIDGDKTQTVVFLKQSHELADRTILEQEIANEALRKELAELKAQVALNDRTNQGASARKKTSEVREQPTEADEHATVSEAQRELAEELAKVKAANVALKKKVASLRNNNNGDDQVIEDLIPRPAGSAGNNFNIQNEMGLGRGAEDRLQYLAIMRNMRDLVLQAGINWEQPWAKTSAAQKEKLFAVARKRHPILERYQNDWATEELAKQYIKNKRRHGYRKGFLDCPSQYAYLKANSAKRDPSAPRGRRVAAARNAKILGKKKAAAKKNTKGKGKQVVDDDDDEDEEDVEMAGQSGEEDQEL
ncbi:hypothetical protein MSAN_02432400 [Mycena sanguinolenta]|uniref:Uncharacterized protein n=1 Tax=Mycena sanguinolenta TaxID=230812 RepID=A0A8H6X260_9AGAR|nr:hypothetical protein MSAN_02432400 [Mycena sanguinolenta]